MVKKKVVCNLILTFIGPRHKESTLEQKKSLGAGNLHSFASYIIFVFLKNVYFYVVCMDVLTLYVCALYKCQVPMEARREHQLPLEQELNGCEVPCGCWGLNPGHLQEQLVFLTSESSLQTFCF